MNVLPLPSSLSSVISPPSSLHSSLTIDRPRPVPEYSRVMASPPARTSVPWRNFSKTIDLVLLGDAHAGVGDDQPQVAAAVAPGGDVNPARLRA